MRSGGLRGLQFIATSGASTAWDEGRRGGRRSGSVSPSPIGVSSTFGCGSSPRTVELYGILQDASCPAFIVGTAVRAGLHGVIDREYERGGGGRTRRGPSEGRRISAAGRLRRGTVVLRLLVGLDDENRRGLFVLVELEQLSVPRWPSSSGSSSARRTLRGCGCARGVSMARSGA